MKTVLSVLSCLLVAVSGLLAVPQTGAQSMFTFLSVRLKGNGDGSVTAVAQNEFCIGPQVLPVTLNLYYSDIYLSDLSEMTLKSSYFCEDLDIFQTVTLTEEVAAEGYFLAELCYLVNGEKNFIRTEAILYASDGLRVKNN